MFRVGTVNPCLPNAANSTNGIQLRACLLAASDYCYSNCILRSKQICSGSDSSPGTNCSQNLTIHQCLDLSIVGIKHKHSRMNQRESTGWICAKNSHYFYSHFPVVRNRGRHRQENSLLFRNMDTTAKRHFNPSG